MAAGDDRVGPPRAHILETEIGDEISLYDPKQEQVVVLNQTASDVWRLADGEHDLDQVVSLLASAYEINPDQIRAEVEEAVRSFREQGLLEGNDIEDH